MTNEVNVEDLELVAQELVHASEEEIPYIIEKYNNIDIFIMDNIKYLIKYLKNDYKVVKIDNGNTVSLTTEEIDYIHNLLDSNYGTTVYSFATDTMLFLNPDVDHKDYIGGFLEWIEQIMPQEAKNNFYKNIKTFRSYIDLDIDFSELEEKELVYKPNMYAGLYNIINNTITTSKDYVLWLYKKSRNEKNPDEFFWANYGCVILHELLHMASSHYDSKNIITYCGFNIESGKTGNQSNMGLTEGFTEVLAVSGIEHSADYHSSYVIEAFTVLQMMLLIGQESFTKSYFLNLGTDLLEKDFNKIIDDPEMAFGLFRRLETTYRLKDIDCNKFSLYNLQSELLKYLDKKLELLVTNQDFKQARELIDNYEQILITPDILLLNNKKPGDFPGVNYIKPKFNKIKEKYMAYINSQGTTELDDINFSRSRVKVNVRKRGTVNILTIILLVVCFCFVTMFLTYYLLLK